MSPIGTRSQEMKYEESRRLRRDFKQLLTVENRQDRGRTFEQLLAGRFHLEGFDVYPNSKAAHPRQTDLLAIMNGHHYLVEAKWRKSKVEVGDIEDLRARLARVRPDVIGCIFNMNEYSKQAIKEVEEHRDREILLFDAVEVNDLFSGSASIVELVRSKSNSLRLDAKVKFFRSKDKKGKPVSLPETSMFVRQRSRLLPFIGCASKGEDIAFLHEDPEVSIGGESDFVLRLRPDIRSPIELRQFLSELHRIMSLSGAGTFAIHQRSHAWYGHGIKEFVSSTDEWRSRYKKAKLKAPHHSEEMAYFDRSDGRLIAFSGRQRVGEGIQFFHSCELEVWLPGIPVDDIPLKELCQLANDDAAYLERSPHLKRKTIWVKSKETRVTPLAQVISRDEGQEWVSGVIVGNPFRKEAPTLYDVDAETLRSLRRPAILLCALSQWHLRADVIDFYFLNHISVAWAGHLPVAHVRADWNGFVKSAPMPKADFDSILKEIELLEDDA